MSGRHALAWLLAMGWPAVASASSPFPTCPDPEPLPKLDSFYGVEPAAKFFVDMKWSGAEFVPVDPIDTPPHHVPRLEWTNLEQWPRLAHGDGAVLRFRGKHLTSTITKVPRQRRLWATYRAELEDVCVVSAELPAAVGMVSASPGAGRVPAARQARSKRLARP